MNKGFFIDQLGSIRPKKGSMQQQKNGEKRGNYGIHPSSSTGYHFFYDLEGF
jgi:hypothetical protein